MNTAIAIELPAHLFVRVDAYARRYGITSAQAVIHALETMLAEEPPPPLRPFHSVQAAAS